MDAICQLACGVGLCGPVALATSYAFSILLFQAVILIEFLPTSPFAVFALFGIPPLLYEASGRSWHGLMNAMASGSDAFHREAVNRGWLVEPEKKRDPSPSIWPMAVIVSVIAITLAVIAYGVAIDYLVTPVGR